MPTKGKPTRLKDVLGEKYNETNWIYDKFIALLKRIEDTNPSIDSPELKWTENRIDDLERGIFLNTDDILKANEYWKKYKQQTKRS